MGSMGFTCIAVEKGDSRDPAGARELSCSVAGLVHGRVHAGLPAWSGKRMPMYHLAGEERKLGRSATFGQSAGNNLPCSRPRTARLEILVSRNCRSECLSTCWENLEGSRCLVEQPSLTLQVLVLYLPCLSRGAVSACTTPWPLAALAADTTNPSSKLREPCALYCAVGLLKYVLVVGKRDDLRDFWRPKRTLS